MSCCAPRVGTGWISKDGSGRHGIKRTAGVELEKHGARVGKRRLCVGTRAHCARYTLQFKVVQAHTRCSEVRQTGRARATGSVACVPTCQHSALDTHGRPVSLMRPTETHQLTGSHRGKSAAVPRRAARPSPPSNTRSLNDTGLCSAAVHRGRRAVSPSTPFQKRPRPRGRCRWGCNQKRHRAVFVLGTVHTQKRAVSFMADPLVCVCVSRETGTFSRSCGSRLLSVCASESSIARERSKSKMTTG